MCGKYFETEESDDMNNYYDLLEISYTASEEIVRAAYKAKVKQWHPDNFLAENEKANATKVLQDLNDALEILTNAEKREEYNERIKYADKSSHDNSNFGKSQEDDEGLAEIYDCVQKMIILTRNEVEYLQLHHKIRQSSYSEHKKMLMAEALDNITAVRLEEDIEQANSLAYCKKETSEHKSGIVGIIVVGIILTIWFTNAWWIAIIIALLSYMGGKEDRAKLKQAEQADAKIRQYRLSGFRI